MTERWWLPSQSHFPFWYTLTAAFVQVIFCCVQYPPGFGFRQRHRVIMAPEKLAEGGLVSDILEAGVSL